jgi:hypothetical protein
MDELTRSQTRKEFIHAMRRENLKSYIILFSFESPKNRVSFCRDMGAGKAAYVPFLVFLTPCWSDPQLLLLQINYGLSREYFDPVLFDFVAMPSFHQSKPPKGRETRQDREMIGSPENDALSLLLSETFLFIYSGK